MQSDDESWLEQQYVSEINAQPNYEVEYASQRDASVRGVWNAFQESATSVTQLYRERSNNADPGALWLPFQTAAGTVTALYKESSDGIKRTGETALICGYQRRTKDMVDWARSRKRRFIRRDELLAYLAGRPPPLYSRRSPKPDNFHHSNVNPFVYGTNQLSEPPTDMHTFKEALVRRPRGPELYAFVAGEIARHCKRPASPIDPNMDVSNISNKRQRFM